MGGIRRHYQIHHLSLLLAYLSKGSRVTVVGHFKHEEWSGANGVKHNHVILVIARFNPTADKESKEEKQES